MEDGEKGDRWNPSADEIPGPRAAARALAHRLTTAAGENDDAALTSAVAEVRQITKTDPDARQPIVDAGVVPLLARLLFAPSASQEDAAAALLNVSISCRDSLMSAPGLLDALAAAIRGGGGAAAGHAAATLYSLLCVESNRSIIGAKRTLLAALVAFLGAAWSTRSTKDALKALFGVALYPPNRTALVELGVVPPLFAVIVEDGRTGLVEDATAVVAQVAGCAESLDAFRAVGGLRVLVDLVYPGEASSDRTRENAASALLNLVVACGEQAATEVCEVEGAELAARALAGDSSATHRGKSKASALLKALQQARCPAGTAVRRDYKLADFLDGTAPSSPSISTPSPA